MCKKSFIIASMSGFLNTSKASVFRALTYILCGYECNARRSSKRNISFSLFLSLSYFKIYKKTKGNFSWTQLDLKKLDSNFQ